MQFSLPKELNALETFDTELSPPKKLLAAILKRAVMDVFGSERTDKYIRLAAIEYLSLEHDGLLMKRTKDGNGWTCVEILEHLDLCPFIFHKQLKKIYQAGSKLDIRIRTSKY
jgi:hypothetical protein